MLRKKLLLPQPPRRNPIQLSASCCGYELWYPATQRPRLCQQLFPVFHQTRKQSGQSGHLFPSIERVDKNQVTRNTRIVDYPSLGTCSLEKERRGHTHHKDIQPCRGCIDKSNEVPKTLIKVHMITFLCGSSSLTLQILLLPRLISPLREQPYIRYQRW